jgi:hypothetical protein
MHNLCILLLFVSLLFGMWSLLMLTILCSTVLSSQHLLGMSLWLFPGGLRPQLARSAWTLMLPSSSKRIGWTWGAVVHDHMGNFKISGSEGIEGIVSPELAEATAIQRALVMVRFNGFNVIILFSDCLSLIKRTLDGSVLCGFSCGG